MTVRDWNRLVGFVLLVILILKLEAITLPGPQPHAVWRLHLAPNTDLGLDTTPATTRKAGYLALWLFHDDTETTLLHIPGMPRRIGPSARHKHQIHAHGGRHRIVGLAQAMEP